MGRLELIIVVCLYCAGALAAGDNSHPQGVRFAGLGFDEQQPLQPSQWVPWFGNSSWPPQSDTYNSIGGTKQIRVEARCEQSPQDPSPDPLFALCYGTVYAVASPARPIIACDSKAGPRRTCRCSQSVGNGIPPVAHSSEITRSSRSPVHRRSRRSLPGGFAGSGRSQGTLATRSQPLHPTRRPILISRIILAFWQSAISGVSHNRRKPRRAALPPTKPVFALLELNTAGAASPRQ